VYIHPSAAMAFHPGDDPSEVRPEPTDTSATALRFPGGHFLRIVGPDNSRIRHGPVLGLGAPCAARRL